MMFLCKSENKPKTTNDMIIFYNQTKKIEIKPKIQIKNLYHERISEISLKVTYNLQIKNDQRPKCSELFLKIIKILKKFFYFTIILAFLFGILIGVLMPIFKTKNLNKINSEISNNKLNNSYLNKIRTYNTVLFVNTTTSKDFNYSDLRPNNIIFSDIKLNGVIKNGIYFGDLIENLLPNGFNLNDSEKWHEFVNSSEAVKLESGCGRMQNRLVTFKDGTQACIRYRQNIDQIQGELFSYFLGHILKLKNLVPSTINVVELNSKLFNNLADDILGAKWNPNKPIILTKFLKNLDNTFIPNNFKKLDKHLNKFDIFNFSKEIDNLLLADRFNIDSKLVLNLLELAQWSDLIIFDYLIANLDRIVNNLYNLQWNSNIMNAPAHNLGKLLDKNLLIFLDNESGLLHGYRLLYKYEIYHTLLLDNLCLFRQSTVDVIKNLKHNGNIGKLLKEMFFQIKNEKIKNVLPVIPEKNIDILNKRIDRVYEQILKCESIYFENNN